jgi:hypothetical protein
LVVNPSFASVQTPYCPNFQLATFLRLFPLLIPLKAILSKVQVNQNEGVVSGSQEIERSGFFRVDAFANWNSLRPGFPVIFADAKSVFVNRAQTPVIKHDKWTVSVNL